VFDLPRGLSQRSLIEMQSMSVVPCMRALDSYWLTLTGDWIAAAMILAIGLIPL
jgi:hypothetical protein